MYANRNFGGEESHKNPPSTNTTAWLMAMRKSLGNYSNLLHIIQINQDFHRFGDNK